MQLRKHMDHGTVEREPRGAHAAVPLALGEGESTEGPRTHLHVHRPCACLGVRVVELLLGRRAGAGWYMRERGGAVPLLTSSVHVEWLVNHAERR